MHPARKRIAGCGRKSGASDLKIVVHRSADTPRRQLPLTPDNGAVKL
ncbi:MAG: hypothetical protein VCC20_10295 [Myxococcota bacterium]